MRIKSHMIWVTMGIILLGTAALLTNAARADLVESHWKISEGRPMLSAYTEFGSSACSIGDLDGNGVGDLAVGAKADSDHGVEMGAVWILLLTEDHTVKHSCKIGDGEGGFTGTLDDYDYFGISVTSLGDLDGDGFGDIAVGAAGDNDGGGNRGAVYVLFLNADGTVKTHQKISDTEGGFTGVLDQSDHFGWRLAFLDDLDQDGVGDLAVGAIHDDDGGLGRGAVWVLFLNSNGTVKSHQKISSTEGDFGGILENYDALGSALGCFDDLDGDGLQDLAVGAWGDDDTCDDQGAVWILFLRHDGTVKFQQKISATEGGFTDPLECHCKFGGAAVVPGDIDSDGVDDLVVGAPYDDLEGGISRGAAWVLFMDTDGTVKAQQRISENAGGFTGGLDDNDNFGYSAVAMGDIDGNGVPDVALGMPGDDDGELRAGAIWQLALSSSGTVNAQHKISDTEGGHPGLDASDTFGASAADIGDLDNDGNPDLVVGAHGDDDDGDLRGAVYVLFMDEHEMARSCQKINGSVGGLQNPLSNYDFFGVGTCALGDLDGDGVEDIAVGTCGDDDGATDKGAVYVLFLNADGTVKSQQKISATEGGFTGALDSGDSFGRSVASPGDLDGDGVTDLVVGADQDWDGALKAGAIWVLFLNADGTVKSHQKISATEGGFSGTLAEQDYFGTSVSAIGDLDGDGIVDLAVGASGDDDGELGAGALWILFLNSNGTVKSHQKISDTQGGFTGGLQYSDRFGYCVASIGDLDEDGVNDLAVGTYSDDDGGTNRGAVWLLYLRSDGTVRAHEKISGTEGGFTGGLENYDRFGASVTSFGDRDGDGTDDIVVGAIGDDDGRPGCGAIWGLYLGRPVPACSVGTPSIVVLGPVEPGAHRDTTFMVMNVGRGAVEGVVSETSDYFSIIAGAGAYAIGASETLAVTVRYEPIARGEHVCTVDLGGSLCTDVVLTGVSRYGSPVLCATPLEIDFGILPLGLSLDTLFTITNSGVDTLHGMIDEACAYYSITAGTDPYSLAAGESLDVWLRFEPGIEGRHDCTITTGDTLMNDIVCLAGGSGGFMVLDVSDSSDPVILRTIDSPGTAYDIDLSCGYAFMGDGGSGMQVYDVADPTLSALTATSPAVANAYDVAVDAGYAYIASGSLGLKVVDVANPSAPVVVGTCDTYHALNAVDVADGRAYATSQVGLYVFDVSDPENPAVLGNYYSLTGDHVDVAVAGDYAYTVGSDFKAIDVSNPYNPTLADQISLLYSGYGVALQGDYAYAAWGNSGLRIIDISDPRHLSRRGECAPSGYSQAVAVIGNLAYLAASNYLHIVDVSDRDNPAVIGTLNLPSFSAQGVAATGGISCTGKAITGRPVCQAEPNPLDFGMVPVGEHETRILTITNAGEGMLSGSITESCDCFSIVMGGNFSLAPGQSHEIGVTFQPADEDTYICHIKTANPLCGSAAFVAHGDSGLIILDVADPGAPALAGQVDTPGSARGLDIADGRAYVGDWTEGFQVIDFIDPANPVIVAELDFIRFGYVNDVEVIGDYAYLACNYSSTTFSGLRVIDISDPESPWRAGDHNTPSMAYELEVKGIYAYVADDESGIQVISIIDPTDPTPVAACDTPGRANGIGLHGDYAYVADGDSGIQVVDIGDPLSPSIIGTYATPDSAVGIAIDSPYVFVADCASGMQVIDITNPAAPQYVGSFDTPGTAEAVDIVGRYAYVADGDSGILVVDVGDPASPVLAGRFQTPARAYGILATGGIECVGIGQGLSCVSDEGAGEFRLSPGQPNPFSSKTMIRFNIARSSAVSLKIYDASGRLVRSLADRTLEPGFYLETWDGRNDAGREVPSGVYFCRLTSGGGSRMKKVIVLR